MKTKQKAILATLIAIGFLAEGASGAIVINLTENGGNLVAATAGGTLNIDDLTFQENLTFIGGYNGSLTGASLIRVGGGSYDLYRGAVPDFSIFGNSGFHGSDIDAGLPVGMSDHLGWIYVPAGYTSGSVISPSSSTWLSRSLDDFGLLAGASFTSSWGSGARSDSITFNVIPEPSSYCLLGFSGLGLAVRRRRKTVAESGRR